MKKGNLLLFVGVLAFLCAAPWVVTSCEPRILVPEELRQERSDYQAKVEEAQNATMEAERHSTSVVNVVVVETPTPSETAIVSSEVKGTLVLPTSDTTSIVHIIAATPSDAPITTPLSGFTPSPPSPSTPTGSGIPSTPIGMVEQKDIITALELAIQLQEDAEGQSLSDIEVLFSSEGVEIFSSAAILPGLNKSIHAIGRFAVENNSLVVKISAIKVDDTDMTDQYQGQLESKLNTSLYKLLPGRYVQNFSLVSGQVTVFSKVRP